MRRAHAEATGEIAEYWPWSEDTWGFKWFYLVHWQQDRINPISSRLGYEPRHTWRLHIPRLGNLQLVISYGVAEPSERPSRNN